MDLRHYYKICNCCVALAISTWIILTRCKWDPTDSSVLPFALAGSLGWRYCGNSCLVESGRDFVDVEQGEEREYQAGIERKKEKAIELNTFSDYIYSVV